MGRFEISPIGHPKSNKKNKSCFSSFSEEGKTKKAENVFVSILEPIAAS